MYLNNFNSCDSFPKDLFFPVDLNCTPTQIQNYSNFQNNNLEIRNHTQNFEQPTQKLGVFLPIFSSMQPHEVEPYKVEQKFGSVLAPNSWIRINDTMVEKKEDIDTVPSPEYNFNELMLIIKMCEKYREELPLEEYRKYFQSEKEFSNFEVKVVKLGVSSDEIFKFYD
ncbi:hypothetical protein G9A89_000174 [Geosiphon pyriformis]|nr:hypothetical protein G9A89_000174 [Geosiphon pyriformis]